MSSTISFLLLSAVILILGWLFSYFYNKKLTSGWTSKGVKFIFQQYGLFKRIYLKQTIIDTDGWVYNQLTANHLSFGASTDEFGLDSLLYIKDLDLIKSICVKDFDSFVNRRVIANMEKIPGMAMFSKMLFFQQGTDWKALRTKMTPTFTTGKIRRMFNIFNTSAQKLILELHNQLNRNKSSSHQLPIADIDLESVCGKYAVDVIASAAFGLDTAIFENPNSTFSLMAKKLQASTEFNIGAIARFLLFILVPSVARRLEWIYKDSEEINNYFANLITSTIQYRKSGQEKYKRDDFIQLMIEAQAGTIEKAEVEEEAGSDSQKSFELTDDLIISQSMQFFIAGLDSAQSALVFIPYLLALYPECQEKLYDELKDSIGRSEDKELSYDVINTNEYLDKVVSESLRMFPAAQRIERKCLKDYILPGTNNIIIPSGTGVMIPVYHIHHDSINYPEPHKFDPERFSNENKIKRNPYCYLPFGIGPRMCIANRFAIFELKAAVAHLILNFKFEPCNKTTIPMKFKPSSSLKAANGVWLRIEARNKKRME